ncbi:flagellar basal body P-ring formation chaperone FlgA [Pinirhizobacter sp.]|jgi:flagella basal body P-ring formation protein FlgA|uniref:flagellar basal body P-ring formation chaperone FlgA n=1 Tax=Pinirhizobacter sp. TaxID=2950432 RepID=UPI002F404A7C
MIRAAAFAFAVAFTLPAVAGEAPSNARLAAIAVQYMKDHPPVPGARMEVTAEPMDARLALRPCEGTPTAGIPGGRAMGPRVTVAVTCPDSGGWTMRIPLRVKQFMSVLVTTRPLTRGDGLAADDVHAEERDVASMGYGYIANLGQIEGRALARPLRAGTVLAPGMLAGRQAVHNGDSVTILASIDGISVRAEGVALGSGDNGARVMVRNANSGKVLNAIVRSQGSVEVIQ